MGDIRSLRRAVTSRDDYKELPKTDGATTKAADRRQYTRYHYLAEGTASLFSRSSHPGSPAEGQQATPPPKSFPVIAFSLSQSGIGFLSNYSLDPGDVLRLSLPTKAGDKKDVHARVVRAKRVSLDAFELGCVFVEPE